MVLAWKNLQEVFLMLVVVVVLPHWRFLRFRATFPCHRHSTLASQAPEGLHQLWALPWLLSVTLLLPGFFVTFVPPALRFWVGVFYTHRRFFYLALPPHILARFCDSDVGRKTPSRILLCACPHRVVPPADAWSWNTHFADSRPLVYQLRQWATTCRVKTLLNIFQPNNACLKSHGKTIKTLWTRLVNKHYLKLLQRNCFLSIHQS